MDFINWIGTWAVWFQTDPTVVGLRVVSGLALTGAALLLVLAALVCDRWTRT